MTSPAVRARPRPARRATAPVRPRLGRALHAPVAGAASLSLRRLLDGPRHPARLIAVFPSAVYLEVRVAAEPRVVAVVSADAVRLPNAIVVAANSRLQPFNGIHDGDDAIIGEGFIDIAAPNGTPRLRVRARRWWDPSPVLGPISAARLAHGAVTLEAAMDTGRFGLSGHPGPELLADRCAAGDLAHAVDAAERIVGLGPGLTPSGDDVLAGLLLALRLLGGAVPGGGTAVWLADWLGAAVTAHADTRTTSLAASLLHCAAHGEAAAEVAAVLHGIAGQEPVRPAVRRLLSAGHTSGADLAWGLLAGCRAALSLGRPPS